MATFYISASGSGDGTSADQASALSSLPDLLRAAGANGKIFLIADRGAYLMTGMPIILDAGGTAGHPVTINGIDSQGNAMNATFIGSRAAPFDANDTTDNEVFRLVAGADNLTFAHMSFANIGDGAFRVAAVSNLTIEHMEATNVARFFENASGDYSDATIAGLVIRDVQVTGYSRGVVRLRYDTHDVRIEDVSGDSQRQDEVGGTFAIGVHIEGTAHDILIRRVTMRNAEDQLSFSYWNGDGFATEGGAYNIQIENSISSGNADAGFDIKSSATVLTRTIADDNSRNYRLWASDIVLEDTVSLDPHYRGGSGGANHVWFAKGAKATIDGSVLSDTNETTGFSLIEGSAVASVTNLVALIDSSTLYKARHGSVFQASGIFYGRPGGATPTPDSLTPVQLYAADDGNHSIVGGSGADVLRGGAGDDRLAGGDGDDVLIGGAGNDVLVGSAGHDVLIGQAGYDIANYEDAMSGVQIDLQSGASAGNAADDVLEGIEGIEGSLFDDVLRGDEGGNYLGGGQGNDQLYGRDGDDHLAGGAGADQLIGGGGFDIAYYGASASGVRVNLATGNGLSGDAEGDILNDIEGLIGSAFDDVLIGSNGDDRLIGGGGGDILDGGDGFDIADYADSVASVVINLEDGSPTGGSATNDVLFDVETIIGSDFDDTLVAGGTIRTLRGGGGADSLTGSADGDLLAGDSGADVIDGRKGDDLLIGGGGADRLIGGIGFDTVDYSLNTTAVTVDLASGTASGGESDGDQIQSVEHIIGSGFGDVLVGDGFADRLDGGNGDDILVGGGGGDVLIGGDGIDIVDYRSSLQPIAVGPATGNLSDQFIHDIISGIEIIYGSAFADLIVADTRASTLIGGGGADSLMGSAFDDRLIGGMGADRIVGGAGQDIADYSESTASVIVDLERGLGSAGDAAGDMLGSIEVVIGTRFDDMLVGGNQNDILIGGRGADALFGGAGIDTIDYGSSRDAVTVDLVASFGSGGDAQGDQFVDIENILGSEFGDRLTGDFDQNLIRGDAGADLINGGGGVDTADYASSKAAVVISLYSGDVGVGGDADGDMLVDIENLIGSAFDDRVTGDSASNQLAGNAGNDLIDGGAGDDVMEGGEGDDIYFVDSAADVVMEANNAGSDRVKTSLVQYTLGSNVEALTYLGQADFTGYGNEAANRFNSGSGRDILYGFGGDDRFQSSAGADTFDGGAGRNYADYTKSLSSITLNLTTNRNKGGDAEGDILISIQMAGATDFGDSVTGDAQANTLYGRGGQDALRGMSGNDLLDGGSGDDLLTGGAGEDRVSAGAGADIIYFYGNKDDIDSIDGGDGIDRISALSDGTRIGLSALANIEMITANGFNDVRVIGSSDGDTLDFSGTQLVDIARIDGADGNDTVIGSAANDQIVGGAGNDVLYGEAGNDIFLVGVGGGTDQYDGGIGRDSIFATAKNTVISILALSDIESISSKGFYNVSIASTDTDDRLDFSEVTLDGIARISAGSGNDTIIGSGNGDVILGGLGDDTLAGGGGNDIFDLSADSGTDTIDGGSGYDVIRLNGGSMNLSWVQIENIEEIRGSKPDIVGTDANDVLDFSTIKLSGINKIYGGGGDDIIVGSDGDDVIGFSIGSDHLTGGDGIDIFDFDLIGESCVGALADIITDFVAGLDKISLRDVDASLEEANDQSFMLIGQAKFTGIAAQLRYDYQSANSTDIYGDVDGDGFADFQIHLMGYCALKATDFLL